MKADYAFNFVYNAAGAVTSMQLGNNRYESTLFNSRLQPSEVRLGTGPSSAAAYDMLRLEYSYGTTANNGNLLSQTTTVPTVGSSTGFSAVQTYNYDSLNRLKDATEMLTPIGGSATQTWKQTYTFDRYGNRRFDFTSGNTTFPASSCTEAICNPTISTSTNRITSSGWTYDAAGNTLTDANGQSYVYDGENKQVKASNGGGTLGEYFYDGDGKRVKKVVPSTGEVTIFVYDAAGKQIAEYSTIVESVEDAKVAYLTADHLGSPRINTDRDGKITARHDYHPYGEEIVTAQRTSHAEYTPDSVRKQFTGYERDGESNLDFAQARMYGNKLGRFTATDPSRKSIDPVSPQTWNRYTYCYNNPLTLIDENGKWPTSTHDDLIKNSFKGLSPTQISRIQTGSRNTDRIAEMKPGSTLWPSEAYKHVMTPDGMTQDEAWGKAWDFLKAKLAEARSLQRGYEKLGGQGLSESALIALGEATHVYEDMTSPAHGFDKTYKIPLKTVTLISPDGAEISYQTYDLAKWKQELEEHSALESGNPTEEDYRRTAESSRAFFLLAFGEKEFRRLDLTDEERKAARALADKYRNSQ